MTSIEDDAARRAAIEGEGFRRELAEIHWRREVMGLPHGIAYLMKLRQLSAGSMAVFEVFCAGPVPAWVRSPDPIPPGAQIWLDHGVGPLHPSIVGKLT